MATILLQARLALELPAINQALDALLQTLPAPVRPAASHTVNSGGKRLRPLLAVLAARLFGCQDKRVYTLGCTLEMLHAATLMHDDVIDSATTRRGKPACHTVYGTTETILAGDALLSEANACVASFGDPRLCSVFSRATADTCAGEILELHAMHNTGLTQEEYAGIIRGKTACLIRSACEMGAIFAGAPEAGVEALRIFGENIGMAFQMVDDALDCAPEEATGKPTGGDLREGKLTPPLQMYRDALDDATRASFDKAFEEGAFTQAEVDAICLAVRERGYDARTREEAEGYLSLARTALDAVPDAKERDILLQMADYVRDRKK